MGTDYGSEVVDQLTGLAPQLWGATLLFFVAGDLLTTGVGLSSGRLVEIGPLAAVVHQHGFASLTALKVGAVGAFYSLWNAVPEPHNVGIPLALAVLGVLVTVWNLSVLLAVWP